METSKTRMASLHRRVSKKWTNISEGKVRFPSAKRHQTRWEARHMVGHGLRNISMKKSCVDRPNHDDRSKNSQRQSKIREVCLQLRKLEVETQDLCSHNDRNQPRNMHEQAAEETMKNCSQEVDWTESRVYRLLTRNEKQKMEGLSVCFEKKGLIGGLKINF